MADPLITIIQGKTGFTMPSGLHLFISLLFGLFGAPATFQRLMDKILQPHSVYVAYPETSMCCPEFAEGGWPQKCAIGRVEIRYLGFHLAHGQVRPQNDKTAVIAACPSPKTKK